MRSTGETAVEPPSITELTATRRSGSGYASGRSITPFTMLKMAVLAPMPSANVRHATMLKTGDRASERAEYRTSRQSISIQMPGRTSRTRSFTCSTPPTSRSAARRAASGSIPALILSSVSSATYAASSRSSARSLRSELKNVITGSRVPTTWRPRPSATRSARLVAVGGLWR